MAAERNEAAAVEDVAAVGSWWGQVPIGNGRRTEEREIDIVAVDGKGTVVAVGSCKWTNAEVGVDELRLLDRLTAALPGADSAQRPTAFLFSRSGFSRELTRLAAVDPDRVRLLRPADLYA